jgi:hypothetical protein
MPACTRISYVYKLNATVSRLVVLEAIIIYRTENETIFNFESQRAALSILCDNATKLSYIHMHTYSYLNGATYSKHIHGIFTPQHLWRYIIAADEIEDFATEDGSLGT